MKARVQNAYCSSCDARCEPLRINQRGSRLHDSTLIPVRFTNSDHFCISLRIMAANTAWPGSAPILSQRFRMAGSAKSFCSTLAMRSTIVGGVPAGATRPLQPVTSEPSKPDSAIVRTSGACGNRFALVRAMARKPPERIHVSASEKLANVSYTSHAAYLKISPENWVRPPALPKLRLQRLALA